MHEPSLISVRVMPFMVLLLPVKWGCQPPQLVIITQQGHNHPFNSAPKLWYSMFRGLVSVSDDGPSTSISNYQHRMYAKQILYWKKMIKKLWKWDLLPYSKFIEFLHVVPCKNRTIIEAIW